MSSMRNAVSRRNHKERSQPKERAKWGLLEKHRDYSLRAKDHNAKKRKIKALQQKASQRNEDEFYFGMMKSATHKGRKIAVRGEENSGGSGKSLSMDVVKLMKTQDTAYLRTVLQSTRRARERCEEEAVLLETNPSRRQSASKKITFEEDESLQQHAQPPFDGDAALDDIADLDDLDVSDSESDVEQDKQMTPQEQALRKKKRHHAKVRRRQLEALRAREQSLTTALRELEDQRARMNGTLGGVNKNGVKFKIRERRR